MDQTNHLIHLKNIRWSEHQQALVLKSKEKLQGNGSNYESEFQCFNLPLLRHFSQMHGIPAFEQHGAGRAGTLATSDPKTCLFCLFFAQKRQKRHILSHRSAAPVARCSPYRHVLIHNQRSGFRS